MQRFIYFFMVSVIFALSLATNVYIYDHLERHNAVIGSTAPWKFGFNSSDRLYIAIFYRNESPSVTEVTATYESGLKLVKRSKVTLATGKNVSVSVRQLIGPKAIINLNVNTSNGEYTSIRIAEGRPISTVRPEKSEKEFIYTDICFKGITEPCALLVDLKDFIYKGTPVATERKMKKTTAKSNVPTTPQHGNIEKITNDTKTNDQQTPPQNNVYQYVIPFVIGTCIIIFVIYITVKKYCLRNSHPVETIEVNTYATANDVVYADLSLINGDSQPPRREEESPYAEIIGVLHPH